MSLGLQFIQSVLTSNNPAPIRDVREEFFVQREAEAFKFVRKHLQRHGALPDPETLRGEGHRLARSTEPPSYYVSKLKERYIYMLISERNPDLVRAMKTKNVEEALGIIRELSALGGHILEADTFSSMALESIDLLEDYNRIKETGEPDMGIPTGWPTLDEITMGLQGGDLVVVAGRPNVGKSWVLIAMVVAAWLSGKSVGILSMEMTRKQIVRRIIALIMRTNPNHIRHGTLSTWAEQLLRGTVRGFRRRPPIWINSSDMRNKSTLLVEKLLAEQSPDVVFIDSAYRMTPQEARGNMSGWERQGAMVGELKALGIQYERPVVAVNQYNRSVKSGQSGKAELGSASLSDSWEQDSSIFLGIRFGPAPFEECTRIIDLTKDREGPLGSLRINFNFEPLDFSEIPSDEAFGLDTESEWSE